MAVVPTVSTSVNERQRINVSDTHTTPGVQAKESVICGILEVIAVEAGCRATVLGRSLHTVHRRNSDYITAFHLDGWIMLNIYA